MLLICYFEPVGCHSERAGACGPPIVMKVCDGVARASGPLWRGHLARARERDAPATAGETPALQAGTFERAKRRISPWLFPARPIKSKGAE